MEQNAHLKLCMTARLFRKKIFTTKFGEMDQEWVKIGFLHLMKDLIIRFY